MQFPSNTPDFLDRTQAVQLALARDQAHPVSAVEKLVRPSEPANVAANFSR
jgi:hypothetical protein